MHKVIPKGHASFGTKNQHPWGELKDHLACSSHGGYSLSMYKTIIELELMCTVEQEPRFSGELPSHISHTPVIYMSHIWSPVTQNLPALRTRLLYFQGGRDSILSVRM